jgi:uncharacterized protein (UPF0262 family)
MTPLAPASHCRLVVVNLDEISMGRSGRVIDREREVAIHDLIAANSFAPIGQVDGPYALNLSLEGNRLVFDIRLADGMPVIAHVLSLTPFKRIVKDYFLICESYEQALRVSAPERIEAIDMGRRGLHDEGANILREALERKVAMDFDTARRLFTLICVLHWKG